MLGFEEYLAGHVVQWGTPTSIEYFPLLKLIM
jgi:hypothetical protein